MTETIKTQALFREDVSDIAEEDDIDWRSSSVKCVAIDVLRDVQCYIQYAGYGDVLLNVVSPRYEETGYSVFSLFNALTDDFDGTLFFEREDGTKIECTPAYVAECLRNLADRVEGYGK